jgi:hypothetical protein
MVIFSFMFSFDGRLEDSGMLLYIAEWHLAYVY